jgi:sugar/nucleoside kinase (ribokinase family)
MDSLAALPPPAAIEYVAIGSIIIDDIVHPDGRSNMGVLGGGGSHAVAGMRVWSPRPALVSVIGQGFPEPAWARLTALADTAGVVTRPVPQPRFWQLFEPDGTRHEVPRTDFTVFQQIPIRPAEFPPALASARGVFLQSPTTAQAAGWIDHLKALNRAMVVLWEPWEIYYHPENLPGFRQIAPRFEIISPQTVELSRMLGETDPDKQADILLECGVNCFALRLGAEGSLVGNAAERHFIPAMPAAVVDETGAGNAYCGGFVVGYVESGGEVRAAGRYGAVSATFALAQVGVAHLPAEVRAVAQGRLA